MVAAAREVIAIVDHTKWERAAFATFCSTSEITKVMTDDEAPDAMVTALLARGIEVHSVAADEDLGAPTGEPRPSRGPSR